MKTEVSAKALAEFFGIADYRDIRDMKFNGESVTLHVIERDEAGQKITVGPAVARQYRVKVYEVKLAHPGRPEGATVANGAKPRTRKGDSGPAS